MILAPRPRFRASGRPQGPRLSGIPAGISHEGFQGSPRGSQGNSSRGSGGSHSSVPVSNVPARLGIPAGLFRASLRVGQQAGKPAAEATQQRSIPGSLHLAMLEPVYRLAPDLLRSGRVRPPQDVAATRELRMTDFRLLRPGGFYHALARYGPDLWTPFTYAGLHATERSLRRKEQHRFWGARTATSESATACSTRTRTRRWSRLVRSWWPPTLGPGNWPAIPCPAPRPRCSAPPTGSAARRWSCAPPGTWCRTPPDIPPWAGRSRWVCG